MMTGAKEWRLLGIEGISHTPLHSAGVALHDNIRRITGSAEFTEAKHCRPARDIPFVDELNPREIRQVALVTRKQESY